MTANFRMNDTAEAYDGVIRGIAIPKDRAPQRRGNIQLPPNTTVVSVDNHWSIATDIFFERFPAHLKDRAPRLLIPEDGNHIWLVNGKTNLTQAVINSLATYESIPGCYSIEPRLRHLDIEGIDKEINFPNGVPEFYGHPDLEVREWIFRIYNLHMAEMQAAAPGRFYGTGLINFWDMARVRESVAEVKTLGLKTVIIPQNPKGANGAPLNYCLREMDPLWQALEEADLPVCFHVGEFFKDGPGGKVPAMLIPLMPGRPEGKSVPEQGAMWGSIIQATWSFFLALRERGLGSVWMSAGIRREREVAELLGIPFDEYTQIGWFPIAYTIGTDFKKAWRKPVSEVRSFNKF